nr:genetic suppressor element 1-like [Procambarus clarkii]
MDGAGTSRIRRIDTVRLAFSADVDWPVVEVPLLDVLRVDVPELLGLEKLSPTVLRCRSPCHMLTRNRHTTAAMKVKLELAKEQRQLATLERERQKEALQLQKEQAALQREQVEFQREREREELEVKERDLEIQREHRRHEDGQTSAHSPDRRKHSHVPQRTGGAGSLGTQTAAPAPPQMSLEHTSPLQKPYPPRQAKNVNLEIFFIKGSDNITAYALSRVFEVEATTPTTLPSNEVA